MKIEQLQHTDDKIKQRSKYLSALQNVKKLHAKRKTTPYVSTDGKTVFYCTTKEKGEHAVSEYERRQRKY